MSEPRFGGKVSDWPERADPAVVEWVEGHDRQRITGYPFYELPPIVRACFSNGGDEEVVWLVPDHDPLDRAGDQLQGNWMRTSEFRVGGWAVILWAHA